MNRIFKTLLIQSILILLLSIRLFASDTWVKTYRPFQQPYLDDKYWVENLIFIQYV